MLAIGVGLVLVLLAWGVFAKSSLETTVTKSMSWVIGNFAWLFVAAADVFLVLALLLAVSRYGRIRLAASDAEEPEFTTLAWISMMFSAGMGIGLMFYGAGEPLTHLAVPPPGGGGVPGSPQAARDAGAVRRAGQGAAGGSGGRASADAAAVRSA
jgi:choline-glycine betaine transporter